ncbi:hypothetical protein SAMN05216223_102441 [Actinacidiphila yanglinensis]|uniref:DUF7683 domain-containing protein n=1 Tax=Actinacidiphila yanglinensis TaxID=310779 RepID=A0A1H5VU50_9ACTN|nr:hypothetical protein [Actinacidiphila yanglinensis]SEF90839.1 hypothetical protein SAMN05216223_102441 [Actinacidiphila yanglinensis]
MPPDDLNMVWRISAFRGDHSLHSELPIGKDQLAKLREVVAPDPDDPWYMFSYPVPLDVWSKVNEILHCGPPDPDLEYFISGYAADR